MKLMLSKTKIQHLIAKRNGYLVLALGSILANIILTLMLIVAFRTEKIVLVPPEIDRPMWITSTQVSPEYLSSMSLYLIHLLVNVTSSNAQLQHQLFLRMVDSKHYQQLKTNLALEAQRLSREHMSVNFHLSGVKVDAENLIAHVSGDIDYKVGEKSLPTKHITYELKFSFQSGLLKLINLGEIKSA